jgi:hypothetical protein
MQPSAPGTPPPPALPSRTLLGFAAGHARSVSTPDLPSMADLLAAVPAPAKASSPQHPASQPASQPPSRPGSQFALPGPTAARPVPAAGAPVPGALDAAFHTAGVRPAAPPMGYGFAPAPYGGRGVAAPFMYVAPQPAWGIGPPAAGAWPAAGAAGFPAAGAPGYGQAAARPPEWDKPFTG